MKDIGKKDQSAENHLIFGMIVSLMLISAANAVRQAVCLCYSQSLSHALDFFCFTTFTLFIFKLLNFAQQCL